MQIKFFLKDKNSEQTSIVAIIRNKGQRYKIYTVDKVKTLYWNPNTYRCRLQREYLEAKSINEQLDEWEKLLNDALNYFNRELVIPDNKAFKAKVEELLSQKKKDAGFAEPESEILYFTDYIEQFIKGVERKPNTLKRYVTTLNLLKRYEGKKKLRFEDIDMKFYNSFQKWMNQQGYSVNYFGDLIKNIKVFLNAAAEDHLNNNTEYLSKKFKTVDEETDAIYLTVDELMQINRLVIDEKLILAGCGSDILKVKGNLHRKIESLTDARDRFLIGAFTAMRFSDYGDIDGLKSTDDFISKRTEKTGTKVVIPMHHVIREILERRNNQLPRPITNQKLNDSLKELGRLAGINENVDITMTKGGMRVTETFKKWELITTHTARRSGCTNMYLAGIDAIAIMGFSGHRTVKSFMKYIRVKQEQNAIRLKDHDFFKKLNL